MRERLPASWLVAKVFGGLRTDECVEEHGNRDVAVRDRGIASHDRQLRGRGPGRQVVATADSRDDLRQVRLVVIARLVCRRGTQGLAHDGGVGTGGQGKYDEEGGGPGHTAAADIRLQERRQSPRVQDTPETLGSGRVADERARSFERAAENPPRPGGHASVTWVSAPANLSSAEISASSSCAQLCEAHELQPRYERLCCVDFSLSGMSNPHCRPI